MRRCVGSPQRLRESSLDHRILGSDRTCRYTECLCYLYETTRPRILEPRLSRTSPSRSPSTITVDEQAQSAQTGDRQAGAAIAPGARRVLWLEGPEDPLLLVLGDADAGVADGE